MEEDERIAIGFWYASQLVVTEQAHREVLLGILPEEVLEDSLGNVLYNAPYFESVWPVLRAGRSEGFASWLEGHYGFKRTHEKMSEPMEEDLKANKQNMQRMSEDSKMKASRL